MRLFNRPRVLQTNTAAVPERVLDLLKFQVNHASIRTETLDGDEYLVIPSYTLPDGVIMNDGLYPEEEISKAYQTLEGKMAPLGHPVVNGEFVSATHPIALTRNHIGAFNRNVRREAWGDKGHRVYSEKWVNKEFASLTEGGRKLLDAINQGEPIHTSTGVWLSRELAPNGKGYSWIARNMEFDHDAILLGEIGAATPEQGVGLMVNTATARELNVSAENVLGSDSYGQKLERLNDAARAKWGQGENWAYVADFSDSKAVVTINGDPKAYGYSIKDGAVVFDDTGTDAVLKQQWVDKNPVINSLLQWLGLRVNSNPSKDPDKTPNPKGPEAKRMDEKEQAAFAEKMGALFKSNLDAAVTPITERLTVLEGNHKALADQLTANTRAEEDAMRKAVQAAHGLSDEDAAQLTGNVLRSLHSKLDSGTAAPGITGNRQNDGGDKPDFAAVPKG